MPGQAQMRAGVARDVLDAVNAFQNGLWDKVSGMLTPENRDAFQHPSRIGWIDFAHHFAFDEAAHHVLGGAGYRKFWRFAMGRMYGGPVFKPLLETSIRLFGATPVSLMKLTPKVWDMIFKGVGQFVFEAGADEHRAKLILENAPLSYFASGTFADGLVGIFESYLDATHKHGTVTMAEEDRAKGRAVYELSWHE